MLDKHSFHPTSLSHRQEIKAQRGCTASPSKPASARAKRQTQDSGFLEALSLWTKLPELISLFEVFHCTLTNTEFSQGLSETVVQKFAIQMQCSAGWRTGPLPRAQLSPAPPAPAVSSSNLSLFLDGPADSGFVPEESKQLVSSRLCRSQHLLITQEPKLQVPRPKRTVLRPQCHSWREPKRRGRHSSAGEVCYLNSEPPTSSA